jgi:hypothetical protein
LPWNHAAPLRPPNPTRIADGRSDLLLGADSRLNATHGPFIAPLTAGLITAAPLPRRCRRPRCHSRPAHLPLTGRRTGRSHSRQALRPEAPTEFQIEVAGVEAATCSFAHGGRHFNSEDSVRSFARPLACSPGASRETELNWGDEHASVRLFDDSVGQVRDARGADNPDEVELDAPGP